MNVDAADTSSPSNPIVRPPAPDGPAALAAPAEGRAMKSGQSRIAAERICRLIRDLRRQTFAWADDDPALHIAAGNSDVARFNRAKREADFGRTDPQTLLVDLVAAILVEELGEGEGQAGGW